MARDVCSLACHGCLFECPYKKNDLVVTETNCVISCEYPKYLYLLRKC